MPVGPLVPGHEIVGVVIEISSEVTEHRIGIGCMFDACRECSNCWKGSSTPHERVRSSAAEATSTHP
ncbi:alcohol dehydrogenase catalytic domain-containing protein [Amycolatopsis sp. lyj-109]|uniref:alcohol dehydrogenase catalytic domain-containing protein n=1 Tax=Amycolatopsis sp. lyj-109 TaxID=2789287 RepID=UPI00397C6C55